MAKHWARIVMGLIFVFATISAPLHVRAAPVASMPMDGMSTACAKAMAAGTTKAKPSKQGAADPAGGCCADGCNCPLSHCPATPALPASGFSTPVHDGAAVRAEAAPRAIASFHTETLIRPPKA